MCRTRISGSYNTRFPNRRCSKIMRLQRSRASNIVAPGSVVAVASDAPKKSSACKGGNGARGRRVYRHCGRRSKRFANAARRGAARSGAAVRPGAPRPAAAGKLYFRRISGVLWVHKYTGNRSLRPQALCAPSQNFASAASRGQEWSGGAALDFS